jgi:hypothetical protein
MMKKWRLASTALLLALLASPVLAAPQQFLERNLDTTLTYARCVYATDVDGDGDVDVVGAFREVGAVVWWENDGGSPPVWTRRTIGGGFEDPYACYAVDLDGDGDVDVVAAGCESDLISWWENDGGDPPGWTERNIVAHFEEASAVYAADVDGDGDNDVLGTDMSGDHVTYWENNGRQPPGWRRHDITYSFGGGSGVYASDLDGDGDMDVLATSVLGNSIGWWENDGAKPPGWTQRILDSSFYGAESVRAADLDNDGDTDILGAAPGVWDIAWWQNDGGSPPGWTKHFIAKDFSTLSIHDSDVDRDGDVDVIGADFRGAITWWENDDATGLAWTRHDVDNDFKKPCEVYATDVDGDRDVDILAASWWHGIHWWENLSMQFTIATGVGAKRVACGESVEFTISLASEGGSPGPVTLHAFGLPPGAAATFDPNPVMSPGESLMTITTGASTPGGTYPVEIVGTGDEGCYRSTTVVLELEGAEFVPEPGSYMLLATGLAGLGGYARSLWRRRSRHTVER